MTRISNVDGLVLILRQRLLERSSEKRRPGASAGAKSDQTRGVRALAAIEDLDDRQLRRAVIQDLLAEHFGREMLNDAKFQQVIDRVTSALEADVQASQTFDRVVGDLRAAANP